MAALPTQVMEQLYSDAHAKKNKIVSAGRGYVAEFDGQYFTLSHYGTPILTVDEWNNRYLVEDGAHSPSDRNAINSILMIYGIKGKVSERSPIIDGERYGGAEDKIMYSHCEDEDWEDQSIHTYNRKSRGVYRSRNERPDGEEKPDYHKVSRDGMIIKEAYYDPWTGTTNVIALAREDIRIPSRPYVVGRRYNFDKGYWGGGSYHLTEEEAHNHEDIRYRNLTEKNFSRKPSSRNNRSIGRSERKSLLPRRRR